MSEVPENLTEELTENDEFLQQLYLLMVKRQIVEGSMECPNCARVYEIKNGIPNMLLNEDEVWRLLLE